MKLTYFGCLGLFAVAGAVLGATQQAWADSVGETIHPLLEIRANIPSDYVGKLAAAVDEKGRINSFKFKIPSGHILTFDFAEMISPSVINPLQIPGMAKLERIAGYRLLSVTSENMDPVFGGRVKLVFARNFPWDFRVIEFEATRKGPFSDFVVTTVDSAKDAVFDRIDLSVFFFPGVKAGLTKLTLLKNPVKATQKAILIREYQAKNLPHP
ncbi:MAG: hypothetical protein AAB425_10295 [Bdellovibrionota bacterium]